MILSLRNISVQCRTSTPLSVTLDGVFCYIGFNDELSERRHPERSRRIVGASEINFIRNIFKTKIFKLSVLFLSLLPLASFSLPSDSTKAFPLNDPRNPNCPCHKYQKLADEEYKKLMKEQNKLSINNQVDDKKDNDLLASSNTSNSKNYSTHKFKKKKNMKRKTKFKRIFCVSNWSVFKRWKDPSACFKWK